MAESIELEILSSAAVPFKTGIKELYIPAYLGKAGVLENHLPYITLIKAGEIYYLDREDQKHYLYIKEGFLEVLKNKITLISDSIEKGEELKRADLDEGLAQAVQVIKAAQKVSGDIAPEELQKALKKQREFTTKLEILDKIGDN